MLLCSSYACAFMTMGPLLEIPGSCTLLCSIKAKLLIYQDLKRGELLELAAAQVTHFLGQII